jgi:hypothetical protein
VERHGFAINTLSYLLEDEGRVLRHEMVIHSADRSSAGRLAQTLQRTEHVVEFHIAKTGD